MLGGRHDVGIGRVAYDNALFRRGIDIDIVDADTRTTDENLRFLFLIDRWYR